jgi:hypothetical protein
MARSAGTRDQREAADQARRETVEELHQQLATNIAKLENLDAWQEWLNLARSLHRYSFNNTVLILIQKPDATVVAGYRVWQAQGHQVRRGERAIRILGPVTVKAQLTDPRTGALLLDANGQPRHDRRIIGVKPVSVFDASQVEPAPPTPPMPKLLVGEAPRGLWDSLAEIVAIEGYQISRGDCAGANGFTDYVAREVWVRADVDAAQAVKTLAHELGHVLMPPEPTDILGGGSCRGIREVEAESVAYMVTQAHGLDSAQYTFNYVAGWASQVATADRGVEAILAETGGRVIAAADRILRHTLAADLGTTIVDAAAIEAGIGPESVVVSGQPSVAGEWEMVMGTPPAQPSESRVPPSLTRTVERSGPRY